jgi:50S ribosomal subunit-associated GTPase HflX
MLVANKVDLLDEERFDFISDEMRYVMDKYNMGSQMISAKTGIGIDQLDDGFMAIVDKYTPD